MPESQVAAWVLPSPGRSEKVYLRRASGRSPAEGSCWARASRIQRRTAGRWAAWIRSRLTPPFSQVQLQVRTFDFQRTRSPRRQLPHRQPPGRQRRPRTRNGLGGAQKTRPASWDGNRTCLLGAIEPDANGGHDGSDMAAIMPRCAGQNGFELRKIRSSSIPASRSVFTGAGAARIERRILEEAFDTGARVSAPGRPPAESGACARKVCRTPGATGHKVPVSTQEIGSSPCTQWAMAAGVFEQQP